MRARIYDDKNNDITPDPAVDLDYTNILIDGSDIALNAMLFSSLANRGDIFEDVQDGCRKSGPDAKYRKCELNNSKKFETVQDSKYVEESSGNNFPFCLMLESKVSGKTPEKADMVVLAWDTTREESLNHAKERALEYSKIEKIGPKNVVMIGIKNNESHYFNHIAVRDINTQEIKVSDYPPASNVKGVQKDSKAKAVSVKHIVSTKLVVGKYDQRSPAVRELEKHLGSLAKSLFHDDAIQNANTLRKTYQTFVDALHSNIARYAGVDQKKLNVGTDGEDFRKMLSDEMKGKGQRVSSMVKVMSEIKNHHYDSGYETTEKRLIALHALVKSEMDKTNDDHKKASGGLGLTVCKGLSFFSLLTDSALGQAYESSLGVVPKQDLDLAKKLDWAYESDNEKQDEKKSTL